MIDCYENIIKNIKCGSGFKNILFTCKIFNKIGSKYKNRHINILESLVKKYSEYTFALQSSCSTWDWNALSHNPNITWEFIKNNKDFWWDTVMIQYNINITHEIITSDEWIWGRNYFIFNKTAKWDDIKDNKIYHNMLSQYILNNNFSIKSLLEMIDRGILYEFFDNPWNIISSKIEWDDMIKYPLSWCMGGISNNKNITIEIVLNNLNLEWVWCNITENSNIDIFKYAPYRSTDKEMNEKYFILRSKISPYLGRLSHNKKITWEDIINNQDIPWKYYTLAHYNHNITLDIIKDNIDFWKKYGNIKLRPWDKIDFSKVIDEMNNREYDPYDDDDFRVISYKHYDIDYIPILIYSDEEIFSNNNITYDDLMKIDKKKINWKYLSGNKFHR